MKNLRKKSGRAHSMPADKIINITNCNEATSKKGAMMDAKNVSPKLDAPDFDVIDVDGCMSAMPIS